METQKDHSLSVELIEGHFAPSEALDLLSDLIDTKINFHKLHRMAVTQKTLANDCKEDHDRIDELEASKHDLVTFLKQVKKEGGKISMDAVVQIKRIE